MLTRITKLSGLLAGVLLATALSAQRTTIAVEPIEHFDPYFEDAAKEIEDFLARKLTQTDGLRVVERSDYTGIIDEQERQKNEGFIDGEVVDQGKLVGARLLVRFRYDEDAAELRMQVTDIADGGVLCSETYSVETDDAGKLPRTTLTAMGDGLHRCLQQNIAPAAAPLQVIEVIPSPSGSTRLLLYAEDLRRMKAGTKLTVYTVSKKKVGDKEIDYPATVGQFVVEEVENRNFLNGSVTEGEAAIRDLLTKEGKVYAKVAQ